MLFYAVMISRIESSNIIIRSDPIAKYQGRIATLRFFVELVVMFFVYGCTLVAPIGNQRNDKSINELNVLNFVNCSIEM